MIKIVINFTKGEIQMNKKKVKVISILIAIAVVILGGVYVADLFLGYRAPEIKNLSDSNIKIKEEVKLTAHRGFSGVAPENTLVAFEKAADGKATKIIIPSQLQGLAGLTTAVSELMGSTDLDKKENN